MSLKHKYPCKNYGLQEDAVISLKALLQKFKDTLVHGNNPRAIYETVRICG